MRHLSLAEQKNRPGPSYEFTKNPAHTLSKDREFHQNNQGSRHFLPAIPMLLPPLKN
jgi:hypothetical protein